MATLDRLLANVKPRVRLGKRIWLTEFGYQTEPARPVPRRVDGEAGAYVGEAALRAYLAPQVDMLVQFLSRTSRDRALAERRPHRARA